MWEYTTASQTDLEHEEAQASPLRLQWWENVWACHSGKTRWGRVETGEVEGQVSCRWRASQKTDWTNTLWWDQRHQARIVTGAVCYRVYRQPRWLQREGGHVWWDYSPQEGNWKVTGTVSFILSFPDLWLISSPVLSAESPRTEDG